MVSRVGKHGVGELQDSPAGEEVAVVALSSTVQGLGFVAE